MMKIDIFCHVIPPKFKDVLYKLAGPGFHLKNVIDTLPTMYDMDLRFKIMDKYEGLKQVLTLSMPALEQVAEPEKAAELAKLVNDEMAELVAKYPDRFVAAAAALPMNNMDAALEEVDRAIKDLNLRGIQLVSPINDKPLDAPEFMPLYDKMAEYDLPIWIHPSRTADFADYKSEKRSHYMIFSNFGWPYETTVAMTHLVFSGVLEKHPRLKFITHHSGGMVPFLVERIIGAYDHAALLRNAKYNSKISKPPIEYYRKFYADTAIYGHTPGLMCALDFFGADHMLFGTDMPYDSEMGDRYTRQTIQSIDRMQISENDRRKIYSENAIKLLRL
jgi:aminocarboxymuconate-semialdehyde decarboxylase